MYHVTQSASLQGRRMIFTGDDAAVSEHGYSKTGTTSDATECLAQSATHPNMQQQQQVQTQPQQQQLLMQQQQMLRQQQQHAQQHVQQHVQQQQILQQHAAKQQLIRLQHVVPSQDQTGAIIQQQQQQQRQMALQLAGQPGASACGVTDAKQEPQEMPVMHNDLAQQQATVAQHQMLQQQQLQQQQQQPIAQNVPFDPYQDIKHEEQELANLQLELQKVQHQQRLQEEATQAHSPQTTHMAAPSPQHQQQQRQMQQLQQQQTKLVLQQQQKVEQPQQGQQQLQQFHQSLPVTTIVTVPSALSASPQTVTNVPHGTNQAQQHYVFKGPQQQVLRAQTAAHNVQQMVHTNMVRAGGQAARYHQPRHPRSPHTSTPQRILTPNMQQHLSVQRMALAGNGAVRQAVSCNIVPAGSKAGVLSGPGHKNTGFAGSIQRDCSDKVLLLPADSSDGTTTSTPNSLSQNSPSSQNTSLPQMSSPSHNITSTQSSTPGDNPEVHTPPLVSSTSGLAVNRKTPKANNDPNIVRCCDCRKKSKCCKCPCGQSKIQGGGTGCNETCLSPACQFKLPPKDPGTPTVPKVKKKPTATVAPNVAVKGVGKVGKGRGTPHPQVIQSALNSVQAAAGLLSLQQQLEPGSPGPVVQNMGMAGENPVDEQGRAAVIQQPHTSQGGFNVSSEADMLTSNTVEAPMGRQQAAQIIMSLGAGSQQGSSPAPVPQPAEQRNTPGPPQGQTQSQFLRTCLMPPDGDTMPTAAPQDVPRTMASQGPTVNIDSSSKILKTMDGRFFLQSSDGSLRHCTLASGKVQVGGLVSANQMRSLGRPSATVTPTAAVRAVRPQIQHFQQRHQLQHQVHGQRHHLQGHQLQVQGHQHQVQAQHIQVQGQQQVQVQGQQQIQVHGQQQQQLQIHGQQQQQQIHLHGQQLQAHGQQQFLVHQQQIVPQGQPIQEGQEEEEIEEGEMEVDPEHHMVHTAQHPPSKAVSIKPVGADPNMSEVPSPGEIVAGQSAAPPNAKLTVGQEYKLDYEDGTSQITTWDGEHFCIKGSMLGGNETPGQYRGGGGGTQQVQRKVIKGNVTGLNMVQQQRTLKVVSRPEMSPQPGTSNAPQGRRWLHSSVGKEQLSRRPLHPETAQGQAESTEDSNSNDGAKLPVEQQPPVTTGVKRVRKPTEEGKYAVCTNCGQLSSDYEICEGCHKLLPEEPRYYKPDHTSKVARVDKSGVAQPTVVMPHTPNSTPRPSIHVLVDKKKFYGDKGNAETGQNQMLYTLVNAATGKKARQGAKGVSTPKTARGGAVGRGRGRGRKALPEPETVTILSSDDEGGAMSPHGIAADGTEMRAATPGTPASSPANVSPAPSPHTTANATTGSRRQKMKDASGNVVVPTTRIVTTGTPQDKQPLVTVHLESRSIRIGSLKGMPYEKVVMTHMGIDIKIEYEEETLELRISYDEIMKVIAHFGMNMPVLFVFTSPQCAARIRNLCKMTTKAGPYFDPTSKEEPHRRVTIIINTITQAQIHQIREVCRQMGEKPTASTRNLLKEVESDQANIILVKSTPHFGDSIPLAMSGLVADYDGDDWEDDDEPYDRSRSPSPPRPVFSGPITRLLTYPAPPATGGISVTNEDLFCLNEGEFLNDVIIDFYLKYLFFEILTEEDRARTHIFSSFFYRRLTQRSKRNDEDLSLSLPQRRHSRVRTWTRHVDLFSKDFIIVPINESAHWYLAVICYPELRHPVYRKEVVSNGVDTIKKEVKKEETAPTTTTPSLTPSPAANSEPPAEDKDTHETGETSSTAAPEEKENSEAKEKNGEAASSADTPAEPESTTEREETQMETDAPADSAAEEQKPTPAPPLEVEMKQPCILIFDSLAGPTRGTVVRTLREYMQVEWEAKRKEKCGARVFDRDTFKGGNPKCPQQTNFSDCGIFVLQYVEAFFESPIQDYSIPMKALANWFPDERVRKKREQLKALILTLMRKFNPDLKYDPSKDMVS